MYNPPHFRETRIEVLHSAMEQIGAATLVSHGADGLQATHVPLLVSPEPAPWGTLRCHFARANPHADAFRDGCEVLVIYQGPQAYVTPNWYPTKFANGKVVPTWNYVEVHAHGTARRIDDAEWLRAHVTALTERHESASPKPWAVTDAPADYINAMLKAIVGVEIEVARIEGKWKVSQNRAGQDRQGVVGGLRTRGGDANLAMAELVEEAMGGSGASSKSGE